MRLFTMTYGVMPTREQYDAGFEASVEGSTFRFRNDPRLGDCALSQDALWGELLIAHAECLPEDGPSDPVTRDAAVDRVRDWMSSVLGCLGIEWV